MALSFTSAASVCLAVTACGGSSPAAKTAEANRATASSMAGSLLRETRPQGSTPTKLTSLPKDQRYNMEHPFGWLQLASAVYQRRFWQTSESPVTAVDSAVRELPHGTKLLQRASGGAQELADYELPASTRRALGEREVSLSATGDATGTIISVEAEVAYVAPRPPADRVPAGARILQITVGSNLKHPRKTLTVSNHHEIAQTAASVNALPLNYSEPGVEYSCPVYLTGAESQEVEFTFRRSRAGSPLATVSELATTPDTANPCTFTTLVIGGHKHLLQDGGELLKRTGALLHVRLQT